MNKIRNLWLVLFTITAFLFVINCGDDKKDKKDKKDVKKDEKVLSDLIPAEAIGAIKVKSFEGLLDKADKLKNDIYPVFPQSLKQLATLGLKSQFVDGKGEGLNLKGDIVAAIVSDNLSDMKNSKVFVYIPTDNADKFDKILKDTLSQKVKQQKFFTKIYPGYKHIVVTNDVKNFDIIKPEKKDATILSKFNPDDDIYFFVDMTKIKKQFEPMINQGLQSAKEKMIQDMKKASPMGGDVQQKMGEAYFSVIETFIKEIEKFGFALSLNDNGIKIRGFYDFMPGGEFAKLGKDQKGTVDDFLKYVSADSFFSLAGNLNMKPLMPILKSYMKLINDAMAGETKDDSMNKYIKLMEEAYKLVKGDFALNADFVINDKIAFKKEKLKSEEEIMDALDKLKAIDINLTQITTTTDPEKSKKIYREWMKFFEESDFLANMTKGSKYSVSMVTKPEDAKSDINLIFDMKKDMEFEGIKADKLALDVKLGPKVLKEVEKDKQKVVEAAIEKLKGFLVLYTSYTDGKEIMTFGNKSDVILKNLIKNKKVPKPMSESNMKNIVPKDANIVFFMSLTKIFDQISKVDFEDNPFKMTNFKTSEPTGIVGYGILKENQFEDGLIFMKDEIKLIVDWVVKMNQRDQFKKADIKKEITEEEARKQKAEKDKKAKPNSKSKKDK